MPINSKGIKANSPSVKIQDVPNPPVIGTPTVGPESATVPFTPATTGGNAYQYRVTSTPAGVNTIVTSSPATVYQLTPSTAYTFAVRGETVTGASGGLSSSSSSVTPPATYELISTNVLTGTTASVTFDVSTYASTYKHLQIRSVARVTGAFGTVDDLMTFNSNTTGYASHYLLGNGSAVSSGASTSRANMVTYNSSAGSSSATNVFGVNIVDILDPFSTSKNKTIRGISGNYGSNTFVDIYSGLWANTLAVTSVTITAGSGSFIAGSRFSLYGIRG